MPECHSPSSSTGSEGDGIRVPAAPALNALESPSTRAPSTRSSGMLAAEVEQKMCRTASARTEVWDGFKLLRTTGGWAAVRD